MDQFYRKRYKLIGGPGCGKTTEVVNILAKYFKAGLQPSQILMIGFANATVTTLKERTATKFGFGEKQLNSIQTLHKYGKDIACKEKEVFNLKAKREFIKKLKTDPDNWVLLDTEKDREDEDTATWDEATDKKFGIIFKLIGYARHARKKTLEKILEFHSNHDDFKFSKIHRGEIKYCFNNLNLFKKRNNMIDFEDMLEYALAPNVHFREYKVVILDEAQDLTPLEWKFIAKLGKTTEELYLVGDDDQGIYGWKGSNPKVFRKWPCREENKKFLAHTHRLPTKIYALAQKIINDITPEHRIGGVNRKNYFPCPEKCCGKENFPGVLGMLHDTEELTEVIKFDSSAIMCARDWNKCKQYAEHLKDRGIIWKEKNKLRESEGGFRSSFPQKPRDVLKSWDALKAGDGIKGTDVRTLIEHFKPGLVQRGKKSALINLNTCPDEFKDYEARFTFKDLSEKYYVLADINKMWFDVFNFSTTRKYSKKKPNALFYDDTDFNNYLKNCYDNDPTLSKSDIIISSIHGVKGMERKIVVICNNWGYSLHNYYSGLVEKEEEELRTCYVGVTRAQEELYILDTGKQKTKFPYLIL
jgi:superfamily I DNA/RNA helicase